MIIAGVANEWVRKDLVKTDAVGTSQILASAVTRAKLADSFEYNETLSTGTLNTPLKSGVYLVTSGVSDRPVGMGSYLGILENWGSGDYFIQRMSTRNFPNLRWSRDVRLSNGTYNAWSLDSLQRTDFDRIAGKKIAFLGDSITANYLLPETITSNLASVLYNFGIGGTRLANHTTAGYDKLSGYQIAAAINSGNWTDVIAGATTVRDIDPLSYQYVLDRANAMAALDWSTIDYIVIGYGTNDFGGNNQVGVIGDAVGSTFYGALNLTIESILSSKPNVRLLFWSPIWRRRTPVDPSGISGGSDVSANTNGNYMTDFVDAMRAGCIKKHIEFLDLYHTSGIYETTYLNYLVDQLHPTTNGVNLLAAKISGFLQKSF
jgi:lysophospholipase L1-like esterase